MFKDLLVIKNIKNPDRISSIDIFRSIAIISVVIYHFNEILPFGYLGVDLFFVISGFLIGSLLLKEYVNSRSINYFRFILSRGFKIWPSYYVFMFLGNLMAYFFYRHSNPGYYIPLVDYARYLFFYKNFTGTQYHWCFEHVWSLCVEEHFYIFFPLFLIFGGYVLRFFLSVKNTLILLVFSAFIGGIVIRSLLYVYFPDSINFYESTLVRIHQLSAGVMMSLLFFYYNNTLKAHAQKLVVFFVIGLLLFVAALFYYSYNESDFYRYHFFNVIVSLCFVLMMTGIYFVDFSKWTILRVIAYYSYNWYLWHTLFFKLIYNNLSNKYIGFFIYIAVSFVTAVLFTVFVEEKFLGYRTVVINKLFGSRKSVNV